MATPTYTLIEEQVLGSSAASVTFSSIPSTYNDLVVEVVATGFTASGSSVTMQFNSDTGSNYSVTYVTGNGSSASSARASSQTGIFVGATTVGVTNNLANMMTNIQSYASSSVYKTVLSRWSQSATEVNAAVGLWRSTSAINAVKTYVYGGAIQFASGSTFRLWGIA